MKYDKMTYNWKRWPGIALFAGMICLGVFILYFILLADVEGITKYFTNDVEWFTLFVGAVFTVVGTCAVIMQYIDGNTYYLKSKVNLKDLDLFWEYDGGIVAGLDDNVITIDYKYKRILDRGYVGTMTNFNHKKKILEWYFLSD